MKIKTITSLSCLMLLSSCSWFSPEYHKPEIKTPSVWNNTSYNSVNEKNDKKLINYAWWKNFNDEQLNSFVDIALQKNNNLQIAIGNVLKAQADIQKAKYGWLPTISVGGSGIVGQTFSTNVTNKTSLELNESAGMFRSSYVGVTSNYTLNILRQYKIGEIAKLNKKIQEQAKNATRLAIISQVVATYFSLQTSYAQLELQKELVKKYEELKHYANVQYSIGKSTLISSNLINQQLELEKAQITKINSSIVKYQNALSVLMNENPKNIKLAKSLKDTVISQKVPVNLPSTVLKNRPDIAISLYELQMANTNIALARSAFFPTIDLTGSLGRLTFALTNLVSMNAGVWSTQALAVMPVLDLGIFADSEKAEAQYHQAYYSYVQTVRSAFENVSNSLANHQATEKALTDTQDSLKSAIDAESIVTKRFNHGAISKVEYISSEINTIESKMKLNQAKLTNIGSIINLYEALGSGYNINNTSKPNKESKVWDK